MKRHPLFAAAALAAAAALSPARAAIHGEDGRVEYYRAPPRWQAAMRSVPALLEESKLRVDLKEGRAYPEGRYRYGKSYQKLAPETRFYDQPQPVSCTAALVAPNIVLTAGHCVEGVFSTPCSSLWIVFDYYFADEGLEPESLPLESVFRCAEVLDFQREIPRDGESGLLYDWALLRLDRPAGRPPLGLAGGPAPAEGRPLAMIGYPAGMPAKFDTGKSRGLDARGALATNLDSFASCSGAPVFDAASREIAGIMSSGLGDHVAPRRSKSGLERVMVWGEEGGPSENAMPVDRVRDRLAARLAGR